MYHLSILNNQQSSTECSERVRVTAIDVVHDNEQLSTYEKKLPFARAYSDFLLQLLVY